MSPDTPDFAQRAPLAEFPEWIDEPCERDVLRAYLRDLARINRLLLGYRPILRWLDGLRLDRCSHGGPIRLLDVGCGYGDTLRRIQQWADARRVPIELTGIDLSEDATVIAAEATAPRSTIRFVTADVFSYEPAKSPHLIVSSLLAHHLPDAEIVRLLCWMERNAQLGWYINDLSRDPTSYRLFGWFARLMHMHPYVQHDGAASIARAFVPADWQRYCAAAGLKQADVEIRGFTPGRLCVSRRKTA